MPQNAFRRSQRAAVEREIASERGFDSSRYSSSTAATEALESIKSGTPRFRGDPGDPNPRGAGDVAEARSRVNSSGNVVVPKPQGAKAQRSTNPNATKGLQPLAQDQLEGSSIGGLVKGAVGDALKSGVREAVVPGMGSAKKVKKDISGIQPGKGARTSGEKAGIAAATPGSQQPSDARFGGRANRPEALIDAGTIATIGIAYGLGAGVDAGAGAGKAAAAAKAAPGAARFSTQAVKMTGTPASQGVLPMQAGPAPTMTPTQVFDTSVPQGAMRGTPTAPKFIADKFGPKAHKFAPDGAGTQPFGSAPRGALSQASPTVNPSAGPGGGIGSSGKTPFDFKGAAKSVGRGLIDEGLGRFGVDLDTIGAIRDPAAFNTTRPKALGKAAGQFLMSRQGSANPGGQAPRLPEEGLPAGSRLSAGAGRGGNTAHGNPRFTRRKR